MNLVLIGPILSFVWWMFYGLVGRFEPWPSNVILIEEEYSLIFQHSRLVGTTRTLPQHEKDREIWLKSGLVFVFGFIALAILIG